MVFFIAFFYNSMEFALCQQSMGSDARVLFGFVQIDHKL